MLSLPPYAQIAQRQALLAGSGTRRSSSVSDVGQLLAGLMRSNEDVLEPIPMALLDDATVEVAVADDGVGATLI